MAVDAYFESPERVAALILVAPAIVAPFFGHDASKGSQKGNAAQSEGGGSTADNQRNQFIMIWNLLCRLVGFIVQTAMHVIKGMKDMLGSIYRNILSAVLRSSLSIILVNNIFFEAHTRAHTFLVILMYHEFNRDELSLLGKVFILFFVMMMKAF